MSVSALKRMIANLGGDERGRNIDVANVLELLSPEGQMILDAGCGESGVAEFMKSADVVSTDLYSHGWQGQGSKFLRSDITSLPFADDSFSIATSVDVMEHLPPSLRDKAIAELVRVGRNGVVIAFPCGQLARQTDENFQAELNKSKKDAPEWLEEHLQNPYPITGSVLSLINSESLKRDKKVKETKIFYSENIKITRLLRWAAAKSKFLYIPLNSLFGLLFSIIPKPEEKNSYRTIVLIRFQ